MKIINKIHMFFILQKLEAKHIIIQKRIEVINMAQELNVKEILEATNGKLLYGNEKETCENFCKNTKEIKIGDIFVGIKGETFDGSKLYKEALDSGAKGCLINAKANSIIEK